MAKKDKEKEEIKELINMSPEMVKNCKREIAKVGFTVSEYLLFLQSVKAYKFEDRVVMMYPLSDMDKYREDFIKANEVSLADTFVFDKLSQNSAIAGYFCPRNFWDYVMKQHS